MTREEHKQLIAETIGKAARRDFCDVVVVGIQPNGGGLYIDWSTDSVSSLVLMLQAAINEAVGLYSAGLKGDHLEIEEAKL